MNFTPENIRGPESLPEGSVFVFGSNLAGRHGKGAAEVAVNFGAVYGKGWGLHGMSYGVATKDMFLDVMPVARIEAQMPLLQKAVDEHPGYFWYITAFGCGLAGYMPSEIAPLLQWTVGYHNVIIPKSFNQYLNYG